MRYLAELAWAPQAIAASRELEWQEVGERSVEVAIRVGSTRAAVLWEFDESGDVIRATGTRPFPGRQDVPPEALGRRLAGYASFDGTRVPVIGKAWWELPEGRFVYWRARVTGLELIETG